VPAVISTVATKKPMQMHISEFLLANRPHLMTPRKDLDFFLIRVCPIWGPLPAKLAGACAKFKIYL
jgi:hypothetical protein